MINRSFFVERVFFSQQGGAKPSSRDQFGPSCCEKNTLERGTDPVQASFRIAWSPCGRYIACGDDTPNSNNLARVWHAETGRAAYTVSSDDAGDRYAVAIGFAGEQLIVVTRRGGLVYDAATGVLIKRIFVARWEVTCAHVSPLGRVTLCEDNGINDIRVIRVINDIRVIDVASGAVLFATSAKMITDPADPTPPHPVMTTRPPPSRHYNSTMKIRIFPPPHHDWVGKFRNLKNDPRTRPTRPPHPVMTTRL